MMFKVRAFVSKKIWGYERWLVSTLRAGLSFVDANDGRFEEQYILDILHQQYPLVIKLIQADQTLSVQVHPDDEYARLHEHCSGKTECWYILDAEPGAKIVYGLKKKYSVYDLHAAIENNTLEECLRYAPVEKGDFVFIPAGTVHAIQGGIRLLEVQQACDVTYRLYDWGRPRELHIQRALDVVRYLPDEMLTPEHPFRGKATCTYFKLIKKDFSAPGIVSFSDFTTPAAKMGWCSLFILEGSGRLETVNEKPIKVAAEDCIMAEKQAIIQAIPDEDSVLSLMMIG